MGASDRTLDICMVLQSTFPPDIRVRREAKELIRRGHNVLLICNRGRNEPVKEEIDGIQVYRVGPSESISKLAHEFRWVTTFESQQILDGLNAIQSNIDLLHVHDLPPLKTCIKYAEKNELKIVADFHELYPESVEAWRTGWSWRTKIRPSSLLRPVRRWEKVEGWCLNRIDGLVSESPEGVDHFVKNHEFCESRARPLRNVPDINRIYSIGPKNLDLEGSFIVTYVGNFSDQRDLETAVLSIKEARKSIPGIKLLLVGADDSSYVNRLKSLVAAEELGNQVEFIPWVNFEYIPSYIQRSDVTLCTWKEDPDALVTLPNKLFQSMAFKTPVIASDLPAMASLINEVGCGLTYGPGDPGDLSKQITKIHSDPALKTELGENGKYAVDCRYNIVVEIRNLLHIYDRVIE